MPIAGTSYVVFNDPVHLTNIPHGPKVLHCRYKNNLRSIGLLPDSYEEIHLNNCSGLISFPVPWPKSLRAVWINGTGIKSVPTELLEQLDYLYSDMRIGLGKMNTKKNLIWDYPDDGTRGVLFNRENRYKYIFLSHPFQTFLPEF